MKKIILIILAVIIAGGVYYYFKGKKSKSESNITYQPVKVEYREVKDFVEVTGQIEPLNRVEILPPSAGRIEKIFVEEGSNVKSGDILCLMSSSDRVAILDAARAVSEEEYKKWEDVYKPIKVLAPISGRIILRNVVEGQTVGASTVLFAMSDRLIAIADVDEADIGKLKISQTAYITLDSYPDITMKGKVFQILDEGKNQSNVIIYKVKIDLEKTPEFLKSKMTANIKILVSKRKVFAIPSDAVEYGKDGKAYVITAFDSNKNPVKKEIKLGKDYDDIVEVKSGLKEGDEIMMKIFKYTKQEINQGKNPFMPQRKKTTPRGIGRKI